jgi:hypothetical protein
VRDVEGIFGGDRAAGEALRQVLTGDELHRDEALPFGVVEPVDRGDVRVVKDGQEFGLAFEACEAFGFGGDALGEDLDRHLAVEGRIDRFPDHAHPAFADLLGQAVVE